MINWATSIGAHVLVEPSLVKYHNRYLYKIKIHAPFSRSVLNCISEITEQKIIERIKSAISSGRRGYRPGWTNHSTLAGEANVKQLIALVELLRNKKTKTRFIEPHVTFYTKTEEELLEIALWHKEIKSSVVSVSRPWDERHLEALESGKCLMKTNNGYKYKLCFKEGKYDVASAQQLHKYLLSLEDQVKMTVGLAKNLNYGLYLSEGAIYTNDPEIALFIQLILPSAIRRTKEIMLIGDLYK